MPDKTNRNFGENVEQEREARQVHPDPLAAEAFHHVFRQRAHLGKITFILKHTPENVALA